jgi:hypothetical protein
VPEEVDRRRQVERRAQHFQLATAWAVADDEKLSTW